VSRQDRFARLSAVLRDAAQTHHAAYRSVDGNDPDWASWYADWLITSSALPQILGRPPVRSELIYQLVRLDKVYGEERRDEAWEPFYARALLAALGEP